jgi:hypothetical protein
MLPIEATQARVDAADIVAYAAGHGLVDEGGGAAVDEKVELSAVGGLGRGGWRRERPGGGLSTQALESSQGLPSLTGEGSRGPGQGVRTRPSGPSATARRAARRDRLWSR